MTENLKDAHSHLNALGRQQQIPTSPEDAELEKIPNSDTGQIYVVRFAIPEFTTLCPKTGQPDFAHFVLDYIPNKWLIESKSLKLYLQSFRSIGSFHETTTLKIANDLVETLDPVWLRLGGYWYPRGGMPIDIFFATGEPPKSVWIPAQDVTPYRGRG